MKTESPKMTIKQINETKFEDLPGKFKTGSTSAIQYKRVNLADSEDYMWCLAVSYDSGKSHILIVDPPKRDQFLSRGC